MNDYEKITESDIFFVKSSLGENVKRKCGTGSCSPKRGVGGVWRTPIFDYVIYVQPIRLERDQEKKMNLTKSCFLSKVLGNLHRNLQRTHLNFPIKNDKKMKRNNYCENSSGRDLNRRFLNFQ